MLKQCTFFPIAVPQQPSMEHMFGVLDILGDSNIIWLQPYW